MEKRRTRRKFDQEFKMEAVRLVMEGGETVASVARDLGIHENLLRRWKQHYCEDGEHAFPGKGRLKPRDEEMRRLKRELASVKQQRDILKKALAIFSKEPK
jgi:transposase